MKKFIAAALLSAASAIPTAALAAPATLDGAIGVSELSSGTYNATFSLPSSLPENYLINSLSFSFSFEDDSDIWTDADPVTGKSNTSLYSYESGLFTLIFSREKTVAQTVERTGEKESVVLSLAGLEVGSGATQQADVPNSSSESSTRAYDGKLCIILCGKYYTDTITTTTTQTTDWSGAFTISGTVANQAILDQLLQDNALLVSLNVSGDLVLTGASLTLDYTEIEPAPAPVPEPSSILLSLIGLGGIGLMRRRGARGRA